MSEGGGEGGRRRSEPNTEANFFYNLILEMTCHQFCCILSVTKTNSGTLWAGATQSVSTRRQGVWGASWKLPLLDSMDTDRARFCAWKARFTEMTGPGNHRIGRWGEAFPKRKLEYNQKVSVCHMNI